eukprot:6173151-Pleurochrysis_carterae.AAC.8
MKYAFICCKFQAAARAMKRKYLKKGGGYLARERQNLANKVTEIDILVTLSDRSPLPPLDYHSSASWWEVIKFLQVHARARATQQSGL